MKKIFTTGIEITKVQGNYPIVSKTEDIVLDLKNMKNKFKMAPSSFLRKCLYTSTFLAYKLKGFFESHSYLFYR